MKTALVCIGIGSLLLLMVAGCGGSASINRNDTEPQLRREEDPQALSQDQSALDAELDVVLAQPQANCPTACDLSARICGLADRICTIANRDPSARATCTDSQTRCQSGRARTASHCQCPGAQ